MGKDLVSDVLMMMEELQDVNDALMSFYDSYSWCMLQQADAELRSIIKQPMKACSECSRPLYLLDQCLPNTGCMA